MDLFFLLCVCVCVCVVCWLVGGGVCVCVLVCVLALGGGGAEERVSTGNFETAGRSLVFQDNCGSRLQTSGEHVYGLPCGVTVIRDYTFCA